MTEDKQRSERLVVAATRALRERQHDVRDRLFEGFDTRTDILLWQHDVAACTLGRVADEWHKSILTDRWTVAALLADHRDRQSISDHAPGKEQVNSVRLDMYKDDLLPPCQSAIKWFWRRTTEYAGQDQNPVDPTKQKFLAMRPRLDELVSDQRRVLYWALDEETGPGEANVDHDGPITDRQDALEWADAVGYATNGAVDPDFASRVCTPTSEWWNPLLKTRGTWLQFLLADDVLPPMNLSIREAADTAAEFPAEEREKVTIPSG